MATIKNVEWELQLTISRSDVLSCAKFLAFWGNIATMLCTNWPDEISEKDIDAVRGIFYELNRLKHIDGDFCKFLKEFRVSKGADGPEDAAAGSR